MTHEAALSPGGSTTEPPCGDLEESPCPQPTESPTTQLSPVDHTDDVEAGASEQTSAEWTARTEPLLQAVSPSPANAESWKQAGASPSSSRSYDGSEEGSQEGARGQRLQESSPRSGAPAASSPKLTTGEEQSHDAVQPHVYEQTAQGVAHQRQSSVPAPAGGGTGRDSLASLDCSAQDNPTTFSSPCVSLVRARIVASTQGRVSRRACQHACMHEDQLPNHNQFGC